MNTAQQSIRPGTQPVRRRSASAFAIALALALAGLGSHALAQPTSPMTFHSGSVVTTPLNVYYIWYGTPNAAAKTVMKNFIPDLSGSVWLDGATTYFAADGTHVPNAINLASTENDISALLQNGVTTKAALSVKSAWAGYTLVGIGDFDGNGRSDILWRNNSSGDLTTWRTSYDPTLFNLTINSLTPMKASPNHTWAGAYSDQH